MRQYTTPTPSNPVPVTLMEVPPPNTPLDGLILLMVKILTELSDTTVRLQTPSSLALPNPTFASMFPVAGKCEVHLTSAEETNVASTAFSPKAQYTFASSMKSVPSTCTTVGIKVWTTTGIEPDTTGDV